MDASAPQVVVPRRPVAISDVVTHEPVRPVRPKRRPMRGPPATAWEPPPRSVGVYQSVGPPAILPEVVAEPGPLEPIGPPPVPMIISVSQTKQQVFQNFVVPKGVDLSLNQFDLSTPVQVQTDL